MSETSAPPRDWPRRMQRLLKSTFGLDALRPGQYEVIQHILEGKHTLAIMPTGAGKSLCYQIPALLLPGRTVVVSPLIALMKDQCDKLSELGIPAVQFNSSLSSDDLACAEADTRSGRAKLVFCTPERLAEADFQALLGDGDTSLLVIDEAHCISQWGHDFRPAFLEIGSAWKALGRPRRLALTATATDDVARDIVLQLDGPGMATLHTGIYRENLHYGVEQVTREEDKFAPLLRTIENTEGPVIVYAATIKAVEEVHAALQSRTLPVARYHGRLPAAERKAQQDAFMADRLRIMVATNAFGLGIDKPDVRAVVHWQMPNGLDAYYQESGRAGRDGAAATCLLLYLHKDRAVQQFFLAGRYPALEDLDATYRQLLQPAPDGGWTLDALQRALDHPRNKVQVALRLLRQQRIVTRRVDGRLQVRRPEALDDRALQHLSTAYQAKREHDKAQLERMVFYSQTGYCRWKVLLEHFDAEAGFEHCGTCDNCRRLAAHAEQQQRDTVAAARAEEARRPKAAFAAGDTVRVPRYGKGRVVTADAGSVTVAFGAGAEQRCFLASYVKPARG